METHLTPPPLTQIGWRCEILQHLPTTPRDPQMTDARARNQVRRIWTVPLFSRVDTVHISMRPHRPDEGGPKARRPQARRDDRHVLFVLSQVAAHLRPIHRPYVNASTLATPESLAPRPSRVNSPRPCRRRHRQPPSLLRSVLLGCTPPSSRSHHGVRSCRRLRTPWMQFRPCAPRLWITAVW